ncbi:uncharacterized protein LOC121250647 [Juglans microcarpa x Juglans regia]|uniref:uncharacterized protein LOC121250647 n=1 Tax=Juglans microcarpa x Juglans regia TaxID=2249226 RepID=UPI001B7DD040|nr:uncharacterized protein LOC121250647 [Juglans microcarpa x Juglans regia]
MLLRSSSTPLLGSLHSSFPESPNNNLNHYETCITLKHPPPTIHQSHHKLLLHQAGSLNLSSFSRNSSPISPSIADLDGNKGFRRAQSEGNLEGLAYASCSNNEEPRKSLGRAKFFMLQTIPSMRGECEDEEEEEEDEEEEYYTEDDEERDELVENEKPLWRNERGEEMVVAMEAQTLGLENKTRNLTLTEEASVREEIWNQGFGLGQGMFLAGGLGVGIGVGVGGGGGGGGGGGEFNSIGSGGDGGDNQGGVEAHFKRMVEENPGNPLFLRNYAQFLYQSKRDLQGAEEYFSRAILADPKDGEVLSQYAKLVWELSHDQDRASSYFERAVQTSPQDSHVHAAYASFLWEAEEYVDESVVPEEIQGMPSHFHGAVASANA